MKVQKQIPKCPFQILQVSTTKAGEDLFVKHKLGSRCFHKKKNAGSSFSLSLPSFQ